VTEIRALKRFDIAPDNTAEEQAALRRLEREVEVLTSIQHPGILRIIQANVAERWFVTDYYPRGTLAGSLLKYRGEALKALRAFRTIVEAVAELHSRGYVHRDIKPPNIFLDGDNQLVLGDFGIVFFEDRERTRLTSSFEKVGSTNWMAPWAHMGIRVDDVRPSFDVFSLGKLLWAMVSGQQILPPYYTHRSPEFALEKLFPDRRDIEEVNSILDKCIVTDERNCFDSAIRLRDAVARAIEILERPEQATLKQVVLSTPDGNFRVLITASPFQVDATPLTRNEKGDWQPQASAKGPLIRWHHEPNGQLFRKH